MKVLWIFLTCSSLILQNSAVQSSIESVDTPPANYPDLSANEISDFKNPIGAKMLKPKEIMYDPPNEDLQKFNYLFENSDENKLSDDRPTINSPYPMVNQGANALDETVPKKPYNDRIYETTKEQPSHPEFKFPPFRMFYFLKTQPNIFASSQSGIGQTASKKSDPDGADNLPVENPGHFMEANHRGDEFQSEKILTEKHRNPYQTFFHERIMKGFHSPKIQIVYKKENAPEHKFNLMNKSSTGEENLNIENDSNISQTSEIIPSTPLLDKSVSENESNEMERINVKYMEKPFESEETAEDNRDMFPLKTLQTSDIQQSEGNVLQTYISKIPLAYQSSNWYYPEIMNSAQLKRFLNFSNILLQTILNLRHRIPPWPFHGEMKIAHPEETSLNYPRNLPMNTFHLLRKNVFFSSSPQKISSPFESLYLGPTHRDDAIEGKEEWNGIAYRKYPGMHY